MPHGKFLKGIDDALKEKTKIVFIKNSELEKFLLGLHEKFQPKDNSWEQGAGEYSCWPSLPDIEESEDLPGISDDIVPSILATFAKDVANRMQVPWEMILAPLIVVLSSLIASKVKIKPKNYDSWLVVPNLWGCIIAEASSLKSPSIKAVINPLLKIEKEFADSYQEALSSWQAEKKYLEVAIRQVEKAIEKTLSGEKKGNVLEQRASLKEYLDQYKNNAPTQKRLTYSDATIEKIGELLIENPWGLLGIYDELISLLKVFEKNGRESDRSFYLEAWSGDSSKSIDRIGRGSLRIDVLRLSIFGAIPPTVFNGYLGKLASEYLLEDGFIQRLQILFVTKMKREWKYVDEYPDKAAETAIENLYRRIINLPLEGNTDSITIAFEDDAQLLFESWVSHLEVHLRSKDISHSALQSHLGKYRSLVPSLAGIFLVCEVLEKSNSIVSTETIKKHQIEMAIAWCQVLEAHASSIYTKSDTITSSEFALLSKIKSGDIPHQSSIRNISTKGWRDLKSSSVILDAAEKLQEKGYLRIVKISKGKGHPSTKIFLHPSLRKDLK